MKTEVLPGQPRTYFLVTMLDGQLFTVGQIDNYTLGSERLWAETTKHITSSPKPGCDLCLELGTTTVGKCVPNGIEYIMRPCSCASKPDTDANEIPNGP